MLGFDTLLQALINGLAVGSLYSLIGLGFVSTFKATRVVNFAQGETVMLGAYTGYVAYVVLNLHFYLAIVLGAIAGLALGVAMDLALKKMRGSPQLSLLIATFAISMILQSSALLSMGPVQRTYGDVYPRNSLLSFGNAVLSYQQAVWIGILLVLVLLLWLIFYRTKVGLGMRAVSESQATASIMGINVSRVFLFNWVAGCTLGAVGGVVYGPFATVYPTVGLTILLYALSAAILGGLDSLLGVVISGWLIGIVESVVSASFGSELHAYMAFFVIFVVLAFKPTGLFGKAERLRV